MRFTEELPFSHKVVVLVTKTRTGKTLTTFVKCNKSTSLWEISEFHLFIKLEINLPWLKISENLLLGSILRLVSKSTVEANKYLGHLTSVWTHFFHRGLSLVTVSCKESEYRWRSRTRASSLTYSEVFWVKVQAK